MKRRKMTRRDIRTLAAVAVAVAMIVGIIAGANWRLALVAALAAGAIALTRLRYAAVVALAVLAITLALAQTDRSGGSDKRGPTRTHER
jgi:uncharacterized membrane protein